MPVPPFYVVFCLVVLGLFTVSKVEGWAMAGGSGGRAQQLQLSSSGFSYVGTSGGISQMRVQPCSKSMINWHSVVSALVFSFIGLVIYAVGMFLLDKLTPRVHIWREINDEKNVAIAVLIGSFAIGIALIISAAVRG